MLKKYFKDHGFINNIVNNKRYEISILDLKNNINQFPEFIILKNNNKFKIYNRNCDHAGGRLIRSSSDSDSLHCPFHNWVFYPKKGKYLNGVKKKEIPFEINDNKIIFNIDNLKPKIKSINSSIENNTSIKYFNHAFLIIEGKKFKFATDPWAIGPAFNNGWWLKNKTEINWLKELNSCDFIYISHNHPDHLNLHTLRKVDKNKVFIIPKFQHDSIGGLLKELNFKNIIYLDINKQFQYKNSDLILCILKSGDFRLDSGIYFSNGKFSSLIDVDTNAINFQRLPEVSLYATSYKGGASGYPLMFENYNIQEKREIIKKKNNFLKVIKIKNILQLKAKYFLPYASAFCEELDRDKFVKTNNKKLSLKDYELALKDKKVDILNIDKYNKFNFKNEKLILKETKSNKLDDDKIPAKYLNDFKTKNSNISLEEIKKYFESSRFKDNLVVNITLTNDKFLEEYEKFSINFNDKKPTFNNTYLKKNKPGSDITLKYLELRIRKEAFISTVKGKMPWEDILIGFQCKIKRDPNIFNSSFWYYFSNIYIGKNKKKYVADCNSCEIFNQKVDNLIYHSSQ